METKACYYIVAIQSINLRNADYLEVAYLLLFGERPNLEQYKEFTQLVKDTLLYTNN